MARVTPVYKPNDYPGTPDSTTRRDLQALFEQLFPGQDKPEIDRSHTGIAIAAQNPKLALNLSQLSRFLALELPWSKRGDLRELAIQAVNRAYDCEYGFKTRIDVAEAAGISKEQQSALAQWRESDLFDEEQRLVIEYCVAVTAGKVTDKLFAKAKAQFGEKEVVEMTSVASFWAFWAMFLNATYTG